MKSIKFMKSIKSMKSSQTNKIKSPKSCAHKSKFFKHLVFYSVFIVVDEARTDFAIYFFIVY